MPDISSSDNLTGEPQDSDVIAIIRDASTVFSQKWSDVKAALVPDPTSQAAADAAQATADAAATLARYATEADLPGTVPTGVIAWVPE